MNSIVLFRSSRRCSPKSLSRPLIRLNPDASRLASLNSAIERGRRRSQGVGFRDREHPAVNRREDDSVDARRGGRVVRRTVDPTMTGARGVVTKDGRREERSLTGRGKASGRWPNYSDGSDSQVGTESSVRLGRWPNRSDGPAGRVGSILSIRRGKKDVTETRERPRLTRAARFNDPNFRFGKKSLVLGKEGGRGEEKSRGLRKSMIQEAGNSPHRELPSRQSTRSDVVNGRGRAAMHRNDKPEVPFQRAVLPSEPPTNYVIRRSDESKDNRIPLSIPYTTPASEFLYGTSVVEAALRCKRRKLYKLYIYAGEGRLDINVSRDARLEQLAKENGVQVEKVFQSGLSLMDKLSKGRPHNGYLLEASPLPKLPVASLGEPTALQGSVGFTVVLNHQSREETDVNGTSNFIQLPPIGAERKPFVLFLDSIKDPGNLGSIIRTASFLGVTAVAISISNSTGFTPVVLKASAGAAEDMTLLSVKNPRGFIADSQRAGWKIYAGVPPSNGPRRRDSLPFVTTDVLDDGPLRQDPIILMLGDEGQGISQHLRKKADVEVAIPSHGKMGNVDSLNVSVAAGVLCQAFVRRGGRDSWSSGARGGMQTGSQDADHITSEERTEVVERDLF